MSSNAVELAPNYAPTYSPVSGAPKAARPVRRTLPASAIPSRSVPSAKPGSQERLHVVEGDLKSLRTSAWPFLLITLLIVIVAIGVPMVVNTQMAQRSYDIRDTQIQLAELKAQTTSLEAELLRVSSPSSLEAKARELGLVPAGSPGLISLETGTIEGGETAW